MSIKQPRRAAAFLFKKRNKQCIIRWKYAPVAKLKFLRNLHALGLIAFAPVAQWIEQDGSNVKVGGSNPSWGANDI